MRERQTGIALSVQPHGPQFLSTERNKNDEGALRVLHGGFLMFVLVLELCGLVLSTAAQVFRAVRRAA